MGRPEYGGRKGPVPGLEKTAMEPRVGRVKYINCEPIYYGIEQGAIPAVCRIVDGTPAELNLMLREGHLDISVISAIEYARRPDRYLILPDLGRASHGRG